MAAKIVSPEFNGEVFHGVVARVDRPDRGSNGFGEENRRGLIEASKSKEVLTRSEDRRIKLGGSSLFASSWSRCLGAHTTSVSVRLVTLDDFAAKRHDRRLKSLGPQALAPRREAGVRVRQRAPCPAQHRTGRTD